MVETLWKPTLAPWRILVAVVLLAAGIVASTAVHRQHGVPLFLAAIACGAVLGAWALGALVVLAFGYWGERGIAVGFFNSVNGDNVGAERLADVMVYASLGTIGILMGLALRAVVVLIVQQRRRRRGRYGGTADET
jgi:hypothetical protein